MQDILFFLLDFFSTREWATITIIGGFILYCFVFNKGVRVSVYHVVKCFFVPKIILLIFGAYVYLSIFTLLFYKLGWWSTDILRETILFYLFTSVTLLFKYVQKPAELASNKYWNEALNVLIVMEIYINAYTFSYFVELLLQGLILIVWTIGNADMITKEKVHGQGCFRVTYYVILFIVFGYSVFRIIESGMDNFSYDMVVSILYPVIGTALYYPYLYLLAVYSEYELWMIVIERSSRGDHVEYVRRRNAIFRYCKLSLSKIIFIKSDFKPFLHDSYVEFISALSISEKKYREKKSPKNSN